MNIAIVSTHRSWNEESYAWASYHQALGFSKIYVFVDDENADIDVKPSSVHLAFRGASYWQRDSSQAALSEVRTAIATASWGSPEAVMYRQVFNARTGVDCARSDNVDWLLHIDCDEYFWCPDVSIDEHFESLARDGVTHAHYWNHEGIVLRAPARGGGSSAWFRKNWEALSEQQRSIIPSLHPHKAYFLSYSNGKSAARIDTTTEPHGVHYFKSSGAVAPCSIETSRPGVLHVPYRTAEQFCQKHLAQGGFPDRAFGAPWVPQRLYSDARELVRNGNREALRALYEKAVVVDEAEFANLVAHDFLLELNIELGEDRCDSVEI
ncbi:MAG TPA: hypothetical protein VGM85_09340 [Paraburkholderia sp.]|jgi:hypothetical protein